MKKTKKGCKEWFMIDTRHYLKNEKMKEESMGEMVFGDI